MDSPGFGTDRADAAEAVRAYLVAIRGGAPFLSGADGRLLLLWLDQGVPLPIMLSCIDRVAARRQQRHARSRLTLTRCKSEVRKAWGSASDEGQSKAQPAPVDDARTDLRRWLEHVSAAPPPTDLGGAFVRLVRTCQGLCDGPPASAQHLGASAMDAVRRFHEAVWDAHPDLDGLRTHAAATLSGLNLPLAMETELIEEGARATLRRQTPLVSAEKLWDSLTRPEGSLA